MGCGYTTHLQISRSTNYAEEGGDELNPVESEDEEKQCPGPSTAKAICAKVEDEWRKALISGDTDLEHDTDIPDSHFVESDNIDDEEIKEEESEEAYTTEGEVEYGKQTGSYSLRAESLLKGKGRDLTIISDRKIQVDLSFLGDKANIKRVMKIIEGSIKKYSSIPGRVEVITVSEIGVYSVNVTNKYLSPASDSSSDSPCRQSPKQKGTLKPVPKTTEDVYPELEKGIELEPQFKGMPIQTLKYGKFGLTKEGIAKLHAENDSSSRGEILTLALKLSGNYRKLANLYKLPK